MVPIVVPFSATFTFVASYARISIVAAPYIGLVNSHSYAPLNVVFCGHACMPTHSNGAAASSVSTETVIVLIAEACPATSPSRVLTVASSTRISAAIALSAVARTSCSSTSDACAFVIFVSASRTLATRVLRSMAIAKFSSARTNCSCRIAAAAEATEAVNCSTFCAIESVSD